MTDQHIDDSGPKRHRSPNFPAVGLRDAVERLRNLYTKDGKAGAPAKIAAVHIGFGKPHGQAMSVLAALKRFGLVAEAGGRLAPTQRGVEIVNLPIDDPRRQKALQEAVLEPSIYNELIEQHRETGWPADDVLASELVTYKGFNPKVALSFVQDFKDSLEFSGLSEGTALESDERNEEQPKRPPSEEPFGAAKPAARRVDLLGGFFEPKPMQRTYSFGLSEDVNAKVDITGPAEVEDLEALRDYVDTLIKSWKRKRGKSAEDATT